MKIKLLFVTLITFVIAAFASCTVGSTNGLTIDAASSLEPVFTELLDAFIAANPERSDLDIELTAAGSSTLATRIIEGNQPDIFAAADLATMQRVVDAERASEPQRFTRNQLALVVPNDDPANLGAAPSSGIPDALTNATVAQCSPQVPCGRLAAEAQSALGISIEPATEETNVRSVLTKVETGEVDAGFVYLTDAIGSDVRNVTINGLDAFVNDYPIAVLDDSRNPQLALEFIDFVLSDDGQQILAAWGFLPR